MEFSFETRYDARAMTLMAKALRKTVGKKRSVRFRIFGWAIAGLALLVLLRRGFVSDFGSVVMLAAVLAILAVLLFEDRINGYAAEKQMLPGTEKTVTVFRESGYVSETDAGKSEWNYEKIAAIAESTDFFVFIFGENHAQLYDKRHLQGGTAEDFRRFIEAATGKQVQPMK